VSGVAQELERITIPVSGMTCAACQSFVQRQLEQQPGVEDAVVNLMTNEATVRYRADETSPQALVDAVLETGYGAELPGSGEAEAGETGERKSESEYRDLRRDAAISLAIGLLAMAASMLWMESQTVRWLLLAVSAAIMLTTGRRFFERAWAALRHKTSDMNTLIALGTLASFFYSAAATIFPRQTAQAGMSGHVYYDAAILIIALILVGNALESRAKWHTSSALRQLANLQPDRAHVERDGREQDIAVSALRSGDIVVVRPGERIAADGEVVTGEAEVDESMLTGESVPLLKQPGDLVAGGTINQVGALRLRVTKLGTESALGRIVQLLREAQGSKAPMQRLADRLSAVFVPTVVSLAVVTFIAWRVGAPGEPIGRAVTAAIAVLMIACPCAMGLATPAAVMAATGRAAREGILIKGGEPLERLARIDTVVLDKTGTLTTGKVSVVEFSAGQGFDARQTLYYAASLERFSEHSIGASLVRYAEDQGICLSNDVVFSSIPGKGVHGTVDGRPVAVGNAALLGGMDISVPDSNITSLLISVEGKLSATVAVADRLKASSKLAVDDLKKLGLDTVMLTGDNENTAKLVAQQAGIAHVIASVLPEGKVAAIQRLQDGERNVAMAGDGINDAPALAKANVGLAMASGTDISRNAADIILMSSDLTKVAAAIRLARRAVRVMKQNLFWAFIYNVIGIPIAAGALYPAFGIQLNPVLASGAMALSSVSVLLNSLRLARSGRLRNA
jgi:Cu+-exporting ATPase